MRLRGVGMPHVCVRCGVDCSRLRAPPDSIYRLPIVVCPGCGLAVVRRQTLDRWLRRRPMGPLAGLVAAGLRLAMMAALALIGIAAILVTTAIVRAVLETSRGALVHAGTAYGIALLVGGVVVVALGLRWALGHLSPRRRILVWAVLVATMLWVLPNVLTAAQAVLVVSPQYSRNSVSRAAPIAFKPELGDWVWVVMLGIMSLGMLALNPITDRFGRYTRQQAWLARLTRARRDRKRRRL